MATVICSLAKIIALQTLAHIICSIMLPRVLKSERWNVRKQQREIIYIKHLSSDKRACVLVKKYSGTVA